jgi:hypothetical protein
VRFLTLVDGWPSTRTPAAACPIRRLLSLVNY